LKDCELHAGSVHGGEAEELRAGIEKLIGTDLCVSSLNLQNLLDQVDARDSLAYLERNDDLRLLRERISRLETALAAITTADRDATRVQRNYWRQEGSYEAHAARSRDLATALGVAENTDWVAMINRVAIGVRGHPPNEAATVKAAAVRTTLRDVLHKARNLLAIKTHTETGGAPDVVIMRAGSDYQVRLSDRGLSRVEMRYIDDEHYVGNLRPACPWFTFEGFSVEAALADDWEIVDA
jgi:hypothetical protein